MSGAAPFATPRTRGDRIAALVGLPFALVIVLGTGRRLDSPLWWLILAVFVYSALQAWWSRIVLDATGVLTVRNLVKSQTLDLSRLTAVRAAERFHSRAGRGRARRIARVLELRDADGRDLVVEPSRWHRADLVVDAVEAAAAHAKIVIEGGALFGLEPPPPVAPETATGWGRPAEPSGTPAAGPTPGWGLQPTSDDSYGAADAGAWAEGAPGDPRGLRVRPSGFLVVFCTFFGTVLAVFAVLFAGFGGLLAALLSVETGVRLDWAAAGFGLVGAAAGMAIALGGLTARLAIVDGALEVRSVPPFRSRRLRIGDLMRVEARAGAVTNTSGRYRRSTVVRLVDRAGAAVSISLDAWSRGGDVVRALAAWAAVSGAEVDPPARALLERGQTPTPVGARPRPPS